MIAPSYRAPLLWFLVPMLVGYILGNSIPGLPWVWPLLLSLLFLSLSIQVINFGKTRARNIQWSFLFSAGITILSLLYFQFRNISPENWSEFPAREANLKIEVTRVFSSNTPDAHIGVGTIIETESHLDNLNRHKIFFQAYHDSFQVERGSVLHVRGVLHYLPAKKDALEFDHYLMEQGIKLTISRANFLSTLHFKSFKAKSIAQLKNKAIHTLEAGIQNHPEELGIYRAMLLGLKGALPEQNKQTFLQTGTLHLFAISGLHVGIVAVSIAGILLLFRIPSNIAMVIGLLLVYIYVEVTGASPSAIRAFSMTAFFWAGRTIYRQMSPFQSLVASAVVVLILDPNQLFSAGFQLSYTVVTGILLWGLPCYQIIRKWIHAHIQEKPRFWSIRLRSGMFVLEAVISSFVISFSAFISSLPLSIQYFEVLAPPAIFLNMLLLPMASLVIISGFLSIVSSLLYLPFLSDYLNHGPLLLINMMTRILEPITQMPGAFYSIQWNHTWIGSTTAILFLISLFTVQGLKIQLLGRILIPTAIICTALTINVFV